MPDGEKALEQKRLERAAEREASRKASGGAGEARGRGADAFGAASVRGRVVTEPAPLEAGVRP